MDEIAFEVRESDLVTFNDHHAAHSPSLRSTLWLLRILLSAGTLALGAMLWFMWDQFWPALGCALFAVLWFTFASSSTRAMQRRMVKRMIAEGKNLGIIGRQVLRATSEALIESSDQGESRINWSVVERVVETPTHVFVYISAISAIVIPRDTATGADLGGFVQGIRQQINRS